MPAIAISSGHGQFVRGAKGVLDEVDEARKVVDEVQRVLRAASIPCNSFHDNTSRTVNANLNAISGWHNKQSRDIDVFVHFNAFKTTSSPMGCEVCHRSQASLAGNVSKAIAQAGRLTNRGAKQRTNLYVLNNAKKPAILLEVCFVDSSADANLYRQNFTGVCRSIAEAIGGVGAVPEPPPSGRPVIKRGSSGDAVISVQRSLGLPDDGQFGPTTEAGVKGFQRAHSVTADGIVGPTSWGLLDQLDARMSNGNDGLSEELEGQIDQAVMRSGVDSINWPNRGRAPSGYNVGIAKTFALACERFFKGDGATDIMAQAETGNPDRDALTFLKAEFNVKGMQNNVAGLDTLRHLFVLLVGLGLRESTGSHWRGKDPGAANTTADTCEAGAWQTSWNMNTASNEIRRLFDEYRADPNGFRADFTIGTSPTAAHIENYGSGTGVMYQFLAKYSPAFAALMTAVGLRLRRQHWGPVNRKEVTIEPKWDELLRDVQRLVQEEPEPEPGEPEEPRPPEPDAAEVAVNVEVKGGPIVSIPEIENEPSDDVPEIEIIIKTKGSVAVTVNKGTAEEIADLARVGHVHHEG